jgi:hypothetical protein
VVIALKVQGANARVLRQSLCLLKEAYNKCVKYDVVMFSTLAVSEEDTKELEQIVHPAALTIVVDKQTLLQQLEDMKPQQQKTLIDRCNENPKNHIATIKDITWETQCKDGEFTDFQIRYCWMSEFRAKHIWHQEALKKYRYMMWFDTDAFPTQPWKQDPVAFMIREKLVLLMGMYGPGRTMGSTGVQKRIFKAFNRNLCSTKINKAPKYHFHYTKYWNSTISKAWPESRDSCSAYIVSDT